MLLNLAVTTPARTSSEPKAMAFLSVSSPPNHVECRKGTNACTAGLVVQNVEELAGASYAAQSLRVLMCRAQPIWTVGTIRGLGPVAKRQSQAQPMPLPFPASGSDPSGRLAHQRLQAQLGLRPSGSSLPPCCWATRTRAGPAESLPFSFFIKPCHLQKFIVNSSQLQNL